MDLEQFFMDHFLFWVVGFVVTLLLFYVRCPTYAEYSPTNPKYSAANIYFLIFLSNLSIFFSLAMYLGGIMQYLFPIGPIY